VCVFSGSVVIRFNADEDLEAAGSCPDEREGATSALANNYHFVHAIIRPELNYINAKPKLNIYQYLGKMGWGVDYHLE